MGRFGGKRYGLDWQAKGAQYYGCSREDLLNAWEWFQRWLYVHKIIASLHRYGRPRISYHKLVVEWGALGLPVWELGRRTKLRDGTSQALARLQEKFDMPTTPTMYAALKFAEAQGADLRAIVEVDFGQAPKRPKTWYQKMERRLAEKRALANPAGEERAPEG